jgi:tungstate transport system substrate-binding protein
MGGEHMMRKLILCIAVSALFAAMVCSANAETRLRMSTTTSTENSGLLKVLLPPFEKAAGVKVDVISVGTGKALKLGENGDVDVVLVHARPAEDKFVANGFGVDRRDVMYNDFIIVGPKSDPAGVKKAKTAVEAFKILAEGKAPFISRGDDSGTHKKEKSLWKKAGITPKGAWYIAAGQGMGAVLQMAFNKKGYTLTDRGTFISQEGKLDLGIVFQGDKALFNPYGVIAVNPAKHPKIQYALAKKFIDYITGPEGQKIIGSHKVNGKQLFFPSATKKQ